MRKILFLTVVLIFSLTATTYASTSDLVPQYHWTYISLKTLAQKGLIRDAIEPGKTALTRAQVVDLIVTAVNRIQSDPTKMGEDELASVRQLVVAYRTEIAETGRDVERMQQDVENYAMLSGLTPIETNGVPQLRPKALSEKAANSVNALAIDIYKSLAAQSGQNSLFLSPYSISTALAMTYTGARGITEAEMEKTLYLDPDIHRNMGALISSINSVPREAAVFNTSNALWPAQQEKLLVDFAATIENYYGGALIPLNYAADPEKARGVINGWVEDKTNGRITDIISKGVLQKDTPMVLTNAVYFKADWQDKFDPSLSRAKPFFVSPAKSISTMMMNRTGTIKYAKTHGAQIAELPYTDGVFSMLVVLPDKNTDIKAFESRLTAASLREMTKLLSNKKVSLTLPKFELEQSFSLKNTLGKMGMPSAFRPGADFSGMNGRHNMFIGDVLHKTFVEVGEDGTEAAAATAVIMMKTSLPIREEPQVEFKADRPFIFLLRDNETGTILFIGRYAKP